MKLFDADGGVPQSLLREVATLQRLARTSRCIVPLRALVLQGEHLYAVLDLYPTDLRNSIAAFPGPRLPLAATRAILRSILTGLAACHERGVVHRDVKPSNVLIDWGLPNYPDHPPPAHSFPPSLPADPAADEAFPTDTPPPSPVGGDGSASRAFAAAVAAARSGVAAPARVALADFGLATPCGEHATTPGLVTLWYRAPELLLGLREYGSSVDVWAAGALFFEMATKRPLAPGQSEVEVMMQLFRTLGTPTPAVWAGVASLPHYSPHFPQWRCVDVAAAAAPALGVGADLLSRMLAYDPAVRISAADALRHPFFDE